MPLIASTGNARQSLYSQIDDTLRERAEKHRALAGMGTTLTVAITLGADALIGHIGDSRAYLLRGGKLHH